MYTVICNKDDCPSLSVEYHLFGAPLIEEATEDMLMMWPELRIKFFNKQLIAVLLTFIYHIVILLYIICKDLHQASEGQ